jgi:hypothetical protein
VRACSGSNNSTYVNNEDTYQQETQQEIKKRSTVKDSHAVGITVQKRLSALDLTSFDVFKYLQDRHFGIMPRLRRILLPCQIPPCHIEFLKVSTVLLLW